MYPKITQTNSTHSVINDIYIYIYIDTHTRSLIKMSHLKFWGLVCLNDKNIGFFVYFFQKFKNERNILGKNNKF